MNEQDTRCAVSEKGFQVSLIVSPENLVCEVRSMMVGRKARHGHGGGNSRRRIGARPRLLSYCCYHDHSHRGSPTASLFILLLSGNQYWHRSFSDAEPEHMSTALSESSRRHGAHPESVGPRRPIVEPLPGMPFTYVRFRSINESDMMVWFVKFIKHTPAGQPRFSLRLLVNQVLSAQTSSPASGSRARPAQALCALLCEVS